MPGMDESAQSPLNDPARVLAVERAGLLDAPAHDALERLSRLAVRLLDAPLAGVTLLTRDAQHFVALAGKDESNAPRTLPLSHSFCRHVVESGEALVVTDAREHPLLCRTPAVGEMGVLAYIGMPLRTAEGHTLGSFCVYDRRRRDWSEADLETMRDLAALALTEIESRVRERDLARAAAALRGSEARLRSVLASTPDAVILARDDDTVVEWNPAARALFGYEDHEVLGGPLARLMPEGYRGAHSAGLLRHARTGGERTVRGTVQVHGQRRDGSIVPIELSLASWREEGGTFYSAFMRDVTGRLEMETELRQAEREYRSLFEHAQDGILVLSVNGEQVLAANPRACELYGYAREELVGMSLEAVSTDVEAGRRQVKGTFAGGVPRRFEVEQVRSDGRRIRVEMTATPVEYRGGPALLLINRDVTGRAHTEEALRDAESQFRAIFDEAPIGISQVDVGGRPMRSNRALQEMLGYSGAELSAMTFAEFTHPDDREADADRFARMMAGTLPSYQMRKRYLRRDGGMVWAELSVSLVRDADGAPRFAVGMVQNVTERLLAEAALEQSRAELLQAQKMDAVGRLAGGVAHDFNNLLTAILGNVQMLLADLPEGGPDEMRVELEEIARVSRRAADLTRQLLAFSRRQVLLPEVMDLNAAVRAAQKLLRRLIGEDVELRVEAEPGAAWVRADPGQLEQVLVNLAVNARDAMPGGGVLTLSARHDAAAVPPAVELRVRDTGTGITPDVLEHVFEPFFTTKPVGKGTGLGLSTVYGIVQQSGGDLRVESAVGRGSTFTVRFPAADAPADAPPAPAPAPLRGSGTVLLVEDEAAVRRVAKRVLERSGYTVIEAGDGAAALRACDGHEGEIVLLVTDVVMPGMNGREVARAIQDRRPGVKTLFMSGYNDEAISQHGVLADGASFLGKPFTPETLAAKVREVLHASSPAEP
jgi:PAS domain S-box-containing protein